MSKVALVAAVRTLHRAGIRLIDVQFRTPHLATLGVIEWPRARYLARLNELKTASVSLVDVEPTLAPIGEFAP
jgi:leucyl/phenylalanyl-tRNA--protein transferase